MKRLSIFFGVALVLLLFVMAAYAGDVAAPTPITLAMTLYELNPGSGDQLSSTITAVQPETHVQVRESGSDQSAIAENDGRENLFCQARLRHRRGGRKG